MERDGKEVANIRHASLLTTYTVVAVSAELAKASAMLRKDHRIPLADSLITITALEDDKILWTDDPHFKKIPKIKTRWVE